MSALLLDAKARVEQARAAGKDKLTHRQLHQLTASYEQIITAGEYQHPATAGKKTKAHNLLLRHQAYQADETDRVRRRLF